ncbi:MAG: hypothetical protein J7599_00310 [Niabella sp.]|nr:hypothetical protein [Niabella sp.]
MTTRSFCLLCSIFLSMVTHGQRAVFKDKFEDAIPVLNFGTFHMGYTPDATKVDFDKTDKKNQQEVHAIAKLLAAFKPTVIVVERVPERNEALLAEYQSYLKTPGMEFKNLSEIQLLAYEVGRLSGATRIYGIDFQENYNYALFRTLQQKTDSTTIPQYNKLVEAFAKTRNEKTMGVKDRLKLINHPQSLDYLINVNADLLTYVSTKGNAEGADQAAKFYHRNLVMFSNLNQLPLTKNDRVFILMGATHTAFFNDFFRRSPKYRPVNTFTYLK